MKNKKWILPITIIAAAIILCVASIFVFDAVLKAQGYGISVGRLYYADNGTYLIEGDNSPMLVLDCTDNAELFKGYENGDKIVLFHDGMDQSFPARTGGYRIVRLSKGDSDYKPEDEIFKAAPEQKIDFAAQYIRTNMPNFEAEFPIVSIIRSADELNSYYENNKNKLGLGKQGDAFDTAVEKYDEEFFENSSLVFVVLEEGSGSISHEVKKVTVDADKNLCIYITTNSPEVGTCDMAYWHIVTEASKEKMPESAENVVVYYNDKIISDNEPHNEPHGPVSEEQTVEGGPAGYCGNTQTTIFFEDMKTGTTKSFVFMGTESVTVTDILVKLDYDKKKMCKCRAEYNVQTEYGSYGVNISESYARSNGGQAELTTAQTQALYKIIEWARNQAQ